MKRTSGYRKKFPPSYYPFSDSLCDFMDKNPSFYNSLKLANSARFEFIPLIFISNTPHWHKNASDEVIGLWYLDKINLKSGRGPVFKQDFIINVDTENKVFKSYAVKKYVDNKTVFVIDNFFKEYGENGAFYHGGKKWQHNYRDVSELPDEPNIRSLATILKILHHP